MSVREARFVMLLCVAGVVACFLLAVLVIGLSRGAG
jgi:hypothetical protein